MVTCAATCTAKRHGDRAAYMWFRCRCPDAREDYRLYRKRRREGRGQPAHIDGTGTARRLRALVAFGYTWADLGRHLGIDTSTARRLGVQQRAAVSRATAATVRALYDRLSTTPGGRSYAYTTARKHGWVPPLAWDDDTIDDPQAQPWGGEDTDGSPVIDWVAIRRALRGEPIRLTRLERHHALHARGRMTVQQAAAALRLSYSRAKELAATPPPAGADIAA